MAEKEELYAGSTTNSAGATPVDTTQNGRPSSAKQGSSQAASSTGLWFTDDSSLEGKDGSHHVDREERLRILKEKQTEERQRKLEELKHQALAAQKFREQKEEERRRRLDELRLRDSDRRHQVEERKRQIWEAERDRREAILRKNQEREARIESKRRNERSQIVFAFGSSTPRMLEPGDTGSSYWATRRATSTTNVMTLSMSAAQPGPLTRRSSERELDGGKKRATSTPGFERKPHHDPLRMMSSSIHEVFQWGRSPLDSPNERSICENDDSTDSPTAAAYGTAWRRDAARRKTDLIPTMPSPRESTPTGGRTPGKKSAPGMRSGEMTPSRPVSSMSQHSVASNLSSASASLRTRSAATPRRPRPFSIAVTGVTTDKQSADRFVKSPNVSGADKPPIPKAHAKKPMTAAKPEIPPKKPEKPKSTKTSGASTPKSTPLQSPVVESGDSSYFNTTNSDNTTASSSISSSTTVEETVTKTVIEEKGVGEMTNTSTVSTVIIEEMAKETVKPTEPVRIEAPVKAPSPTNVPVEPAAAPSQPVVAPQPMTDSTIELPEGDMTASMIARVRITTEEEAKAALAERRRIAREQAEREAELERQRLEAERLAEEEKIRKEEEEHRRMEEEQLRLLEEARKSEELRLQQAIEEAEKREEEERQRKEEELKQKLEKEEADRKAKEEAEKQRIEMEIRLKKEEEERQARKKRVEAIMLRTRGKGSMTSNTTPTKDSEEEDGMSSDENRKPAEPAAESDKFLDSERSHSDANVQENNNRHNGHHNGSYNSVTQNNVTNTLLVNLGEERVTELHRVNDILETNGGKLNAEAPQFIPQFQEKKDTHTVNDLLS